MGHLVRISNTLVKFGEMDEQVIDGAIAYFPRV